LIEVHDFHKAFADHVAVRGLSFCALPGQILGIIGPNGAGKTTTMRALAGIIAPSRGRVSVAGCDLASEPIAAKSLLAFVPDEPPLFHDMTVTEHLAFYASVYRVADADKKARQLLDEFELAAKARTPASDLSRGMRQKLAICCAYLHDPQAILFDEPLTGLDPKGIRVFKQSIEQRAEAGAAVMISSHLLAMVEDICTHVLILAAGESKFFGTIDELRESFHEASGDSSLEDIFFAATSEPLAVTL
jgi:ABC-2 type transport system ATP-binding protein